MAIPKEQLIELYRKAAMAPQGQPQQYGSYPVAPESIPQQQGIYSQPQGYAPMAQPHQQEQIPYPQYQQQAYALVPENAYQQQTQQQWQQQFPYPEQVQQTPYPTYQTPYDTQQPGTPFTIEQEPGLFATIKHFLLVALVTSSIVAGIFYGPLLANQAEYWWKQNYQVPAERDVRNAQRGIFNAIYPDEVAISPLASADYTGSPDVPIIPQDNRVVISNANVNAPIMPITDFSEQGVLNVIQTGVGYYTNTAEPGTAGNAVITGHSSYYLWDKGQFKFVFSHLESLPIGGKITIYWDGKKLDYTIFEMKKVKPNSEEAAWVFSQDAYKNDSIITAITCWPTGTAQQRLIIRARLDNYTAAPTQQRQTASQDPAPINPSGAFSNLPYIL